VVEVLAAVAVPATAGRERTYQHQRRQPGARSSHHSALGVSTTNDTGPVAEATDPEGATLRSDLLAGGGLGGAATAAADGAGDDDGAENQSDDNLLHRILHRNGVQVVHEEATLTAGRSDRGPLVCWAVTGEPTPPTPH
jgi:hypothetical protein